MGLSNFIQNTRRKRIATQAAHALDYDQEVHKLLEGELKKHEIYMLQEIIDEAQRELDKFSMIDIKAAGIAYMIKKFKAQIEAIKAE